MKEIFVIMKKKLILLLMAMALIVLPIGSAMASSDEGTPADEDQYMGEYLKTPRASQAKSQKVGNYATITSNCWLGNKVTSGNTLQWDYQVSAVYTKKDKDKAPDVNTIRTTWYGGATLRKSATVSLGITDSGASASISTTWQSVKTPSKYWENTKGQHSSSYRSSLLVAPRGDYSSGIYITNTARVTVKGDNKPYEAVAGV